MDLSRRNFIKTACLCSIFPASAIKSSFGAAERPKADRPPNILFILTDDQGYGDIGRHGHPLLKTPNIDRLYDESVRFDNFYVSPCCAPTRAALLTGMHEFKNGVTHTIEPREHLNKDAVTLQELLKKRGYATGHFGKWHLGNSPGYFAHERGFDVSVRPCGVHTSSNFDAGIIRNGKQEDSKGFREDVLFDEAINFIEDNKDKPFFCYLATFSPHTPLVAPEKFIKPYKGKTRDDIAVFLGMIANIDWNVGRIMSKLDQLGLDDNTIVMFMNDNGQTVGLDLYNADMRGCKCTIWHGGSRAMSFWRWKGVWKPRTEDALTAHLDVLPTLTELSGAEIPAGTRKRLDGYSLVELLESKDGDFPRDRKLYEHVARWPNGMADSHKYAMAAVRQGNYLYVRSRPCDNPECTPKVMGNQCHTLRLVEKGATAATYTRDNAQFHWGVTPGDGWALYDTKKDPGCMNDISKKHPVLVKQLKADYDKWWDTVRPAMINEE
ncbi:Arylsulfatase [Limihaloglobus sulfuriphilus]|uniref:Arylsulfatase n=1 Tax=Limihaloglobus sulfuriphilus TaxID=1851148 RepID=A0A1Q2MBE6_9BACT|nr:arylsulfatase [Limihaloglobus sulfuriphilus]AQQ70043.1 Arylsulfatase [Limihaloglobus sulfuriphilus]